MADVQEYSVSINFKTKGAEDVEKKLNKTKDSLGKLQGIANGIKFTAIIAGAKRLGESMFKLTGATANYIETINLFRASMGSAADKATEFVDKAERLLGLDPENLRNSIASFYNLADGFGIASDRAYIMSENLTQLAGDFSSFANISFESAQKKLMSGFSGQILPLRQYGIALDQATLQEKAYSLGINQRVKDMTRAQKAELIYYQIMTSTTKMQGDLGRSLLSPANAVRVMQNEFRALARAVGSVLIPIMMKLIPVIRAVTQLLIEAAQALAHFFGFEMSNYEADLSSVGNMLGGVSDGIGDIGDEAEGTAKKLNKMLMPFDELNNINFDTGGGSGGAGIGGGGIGGDLGLDLPTYNMFDSLTGGMQEKIEKIKNTIKEILPYLATIGAIIAGWKISSSVVGILSKLLGWNGIQESAALKIGLGITLLITGVALVFGSIHKTLTEGATIESLLQGIFGAGLAGIGAGLLFSGPVGWTVFGVLTLIVTTVWLFKKNWEALDKLAEAQGWDYDGMTFKEKLVFEFQSKLDLTGLTNVDENTPYGQAVKENSIKTRLERMGEDLKKGFAPIWNELSKGGEELQRKFNYIKIIFDRFFEDLKDIPRRAQLMGQTLGTLAGILFNRFLTDLQDIPRRAETLFKVIGKVIEFDLERTKIFILEKIPKFFQETLPNFITQQIPAFIGKVIEGLKKEFEIKWNLFTQNALPWGDSLIKGIGEGIEKAWNWFWGIVGGFIDKFVQGFKEKLGIHSPSTVFYEIGVNMIQGLINGILSIKDRVGEEFERIKIKVLEKFDTIKTTITEKVERIWSNISGTFERIKNSMTNPIENAKNTIETTINKIKGFFNFNWKLPSIKVPEMSWSTQPAPEWAAKILRALSLPTDVPKLNVRWVTKYAKGGFPDAGDLFLANEAGPELVGKIGNRTAVANQNQIVEAVAKGVYDAVVSANSQNNSNQTPYIVVNLGNENLYKGYGQYKNEQSNMYGITV